MTLTHSLILGGLCGTVAIPSEPAWASTIDDPMAYCKATGTRDKPRLLPQNLKGLAVAALGLAPSAAQSGGYFWRCMDGAVFVCVVGANIPCELKADRARINAGAQAFCREKHDAEVVPAYATGHRTIYAWRCVSGSAVHGKALAQLDRRGYGIDVWHRLLAHP